MSLPCPVRSLVTAFTFAAGFLFASPAAAEHTQSAPDTTGIAALRAEISRTETGRSLLSYADKNRVVMAFDSTLENHGNYDIDRNILTINPHQTPGDQVVCAAHELRHVWQHFALKIDSVMDATTDPHQSWALQRHIEADAHAFSFYFLAERLNKFGNEDSTMLYNPVEVWIAENLKNEMQSPDGLTPAEYLHQGVALSFCGLSGYNELHDRHVRMQLGLMEFYLKAAYNRIEAGKFELAEKPLSLYTELRNQTVDDAAMAAYLRRFGGISLDPETETALADTTLVSDKTLIHGLPFSFNMGADGKDFPARKNENLEVLKDYLRQMNEAGDKLVERMAAWRSAKTPVITSGVRGP